MNYKLEEAEEEKYATLTFIIYSIILMYSRAYYFA